MKNRYLKFINYISRTWIIAENAKLMLIKSIFQYIGPSPTFSFYAYILRPLYILKRYSCYIPMFVLHEHNWTWQKPLCMCGQNPIRDDQKHFSSGECFCTAKGSHDRRRLYIKKYSEIQPGFKPEFQSDALRLSHCTVHIGRYFRCWGGGGGGGLEGGLYV